jgi:hypothetical protein
MGYSISWCAVPEADAQAFLERLDLRPTGASERVPESLISTAALDTGWRVLWYDEYDCPFLRSGDLKVISRDHDVLLCRVEEHVMASSAEFWSGGTRTWWISHEAENGPNALDIDGDLPECFPAVRAEMETAQRAQREDDPLRADYLFDIPLKVAHSLVGFKHDEDCPHLTDGAFVILSGSRAKRGLLSRLFRGLTGRLVSG